MSMNELRWSQCSASRRTRSSRSSRAAGPCLLYPNAQLLAEPLCLVNKPVGEYLVTFVRVAV